METLIQKLADLDEEGVLAGVKAGLESGADPMALFDACRQGIVLVGHRYEDGEYFISDLMMAAEIFKQAAELLEPKLTGTVTQKKGALVIGTVEGDIHDIGKDLVVSLLRASGFDVHDLGVDVAPALFVEKAQETGARVVALSGLLTIAFDTMKATVDAFDQAGLRPGVKIMIGGGPVTESVCAYAGADAWGNNAQAAVNLAMGWMEG